MSCYRTRALVSLLIATIATTLQHSMCPAIITTASGFLMPTITQPRIIHSNYPKQCPIVLRVLEKGDSNSDDIETRKESAAAAAASTTLNDDDSLSTSSSSSTINPEQQQQQQQQQPELLAPSAKDLMMMVGTSPRRLFNGAVTATGIALAGNFLGVTSKLLTFVPEETVEATGLDTYYPRGDYKRVRGKGYSLVIPKEWVGDTFLELAKAQRLAKKLDYSMKQNNAGAGDSTLPDAAYGPPGRLNPKTGVSEQGDTNVSVIVAGGLSGFSLRGTLGPPEEAAEKLFRLSIAPEGSGRTITLRSAVEDTNRQVYQLEYDVDRGERGPPMRAIAVIAAGSPAGTKLITMVVTAPKRTWTSDATLAAKFEHIASSFHTTII